MNKPDKQAKDITKAEVKAFIIANQAQFIKNPANGALKESDFDVTITVNSDNTISVTIQLTTYINGSGDLQSGSTALPDSPTYQFNGFFTPGAVTPKPDAGEDVGNALPPELKPKPQPGTGKPPFADDIINNPNIKDEIGDAIQGQLPDLIPGLPPGSTVDKPNISLTPQPNGDITVNVPILGPGGENLGNHQIVIPGYQPTPNKVNLNTHAINSQIGQMVANGMKPDQIKEAIAQQIINEIVNGNYPQA